MPDDPTPTMTAEHERVLLSSALQNADTAAELLPMVQPPWFADGRLARTWSAPPSSGSRSLPPRGRIRPNPGIPNTR